MMKYVACLTLFVALCSGCSRSTAPSYSDLLDQADSEFADVYIDGSVSDVKEALHVFLARLDELQRHPGCPPNQEIAFDISRGLTEARLANLHASLGNSEKAKAFTAAALTHMPDAQARTEEELFALVNRMDKRLNPKWKQ